MRRLLTNMIFAFCFCFILTAVNAQGGTLTVTKTADTNDGLCNSDCSLREAIAAANPFGDEIVFASPLFDSPQIISLEDADGFRDLVIGKSVTITGKGAHLLTIKRSMPPAVTKYRIFTIGGAFTVNLSGMTIANGDVHGDGGGISVFGSIVTITNSVIRNNIAIGFGGGIRVISGGSLTVTNSTITENVALHPDQASAGGIHSEDSTLEVINSTISGNVKHFTSGSNGGGIYTRNGTATITNSTITDNQVVSSFHAGGLSSSGTTLTIRNTIIAGNRNNTSSPDVRIPPSNTLTSEGYNLIGNVGDTVGFNQAGDQTGNSTSPLNPLLDALGDYGGTTPTHRLQANSPAEDKGKNFGSTTDQRGQIRTIDDIAIANASGGDGTDIGAFEDQTATHIIVTKTADTNDGVCDSDCSLREAIAAAGAGNNIDFSSLFDTAQVITLSDVAGFRTLTINKNLTINGKGANLLTIRRDTNSPVNFNILNVGAVNLVLNGLTISGGKGSSVVTNSGGISADFNSNLTINNCQITNNEIISASNSALGGGISSRGATLKINNSTISNNRVTVGGIGNAAGGIYASAAEITIVNSTISGNTVSSSSGTDNGGGIYINGVATITSSTITDNGADGANSASGIYNNFVMTIRNTIVAGNRNNSTQPDVANGSSITSQGFNLIGNVGTASGFDQPTDQTGNSSTPINPLLKPLANNGGTTPTHAISVGSRAIDKGKSFGLTTDQRGQPRPYDNVAILQPVGGDSSDIGAFESDIFPRIVVTKIEDTNDGVCDSDCSLREAIAAAVSGNQIIFASPLFDTPQVITLSESVGFRQLLIDKSITLTGKGAHLLTIQRAPAASAFFRIFFVASDVNFILTGVTVSGGKTGASTAFGGGIYNAPGATLTIDTCHITGNSVISSSGDNLGGGISSSGKLYISGSTISNNVVMTDSPYAGGGIFTEGPETIIASSTISGNTVVNNTGNTTNNNGGGIYNEGPTTIRHSTVTDNGAVGANSGSGIYNAHTIYIGNTIVAANRNSATQPDVALDNSNPTYSFASDGFNLIGSAPANIGFNNGVSNDQVGTVSSRLNPQLDPLGMYGGTTPTHRLQSNSPAIDKGSSFGVIRDQRGANRPVDISTVSNGAGNAADIGAFEVQTVASNQPPLAQPNSYTTTMNTTLTVITPGVLTNDTDADGTALMAIKVTDPSHGTLTLHTSGSFFYTPNAGYAGGDSFTYKANDGALDSNVVIVTIIVTNTGPVATADSYSTTRNTPLTVNAPGVLTNDTDADNHPLTAIKVSNPSHGTVTLNANGSFTYTPHLNYFGTDSFTYKANDGGADSNTVTVTLNVNVGSALSMTVTKTEDTNDGVCNADCSLREAIAAAAPGDSVNFASPLFDSPQTITLSEAGGFQSLVIGKNLTITGRGANLLTVRRSPSATAEFRVFEISDGFNVNISGMTISGGATSGGGGGIHNKGTLVLTASAVKGNSITDIGAGIYNAPNSTLNVIDSTISNNTAHNATGGGIAGVGAINITNSTISGNAARDGGGIIVFSSTTLTITNSTISNNSAQVSGGGIHAQNGGVTLRNSIVADNTATNGSDLYGTFNSQGFNLIGKGSGATITPTTGDQIGTSAAPIDPKLGALQNNGGTTETRALFAGSPAIDKGNSSGSTTDQRGSARPVNLVDATYPNASGGDGSDIGAYEAQTVPSGGSVPSFVVTKAADNNDGVCNADCSLREAITIANSNPGPDIITFDIGGAGPHTIQLATALPELSQSVKILNDSNERITVRGEGAADPYRIFTINTGQIVQISSLTIANGNAGDIGGGIRNNGTLTLLNSTVRDNASSTFGGGIFSDFGSTLTITGSTISGNTVSSGTGGGIAGDGTITITGSTISGNSATHGGGIVDLDPSVTTITNCTISNNSAQNAGGGIYEQNAGVILRNTIVADNTAPTNPDLRGTFNSQGFNLIENVSGVTVNETQNAGTNITGQDPNLGVLQNNGGTTETRALLTGSPAIDKGNSFGSATDQRGSTRPVDNASIPNASGGDGSDIGAFELQTNDIQTPVANPDSYTTNQNVTLIVNAPGVLSNDTDGNGNSLSAVKVSDPAHGSLFLNPDGSFIYIPAVNYAGTDSFTYKANDGTADSNIVTVTLTVNIGMTLVVTKAQDTNDGVCDTDCSLREAIATSQSGGTIVFSSLFESPQVITLMGSDTGGFDDLVINKSLTVNGKGANLLYIQRNEASGNTFRVFNINGNGVTVNLNNLTVSNGKTNASGGGINANGGVTLNITGCNIASNSADIMGGGIYVASDSTLNLTNSTIVANKGNGADSSGVGIHNEGILTITNSTISSNVQLQTSDAGGGGIWTNNTTTITNSTITENHHSMPGSGSGVFRSGNVGTVTLRNTIVAGNFINSTYPDVSGAFVSEGYNLIGNVGSATGFTQTGDQVGTSSSILNPGLAPLDFYGGKTQTHALLSNSPAVNAADPNNMLDFDQRGVQRPVNGNADIGAFEVNFTFSNSPTGGGGQGTLPNGAIGQPYSVTFSANQLSRPGGFRSNDSKSSEPSSEANPEGTPPFTFTIISGNLPNGLTLNPNTGQLSGTPTQAGTFTFILKVTNNGDGKSGTQQYVLVIGAPTAAGVTVSGRVMTPEGRGLTKARVVLTDSQGNTRTTTTSSFGYYRFDDVEAGQTYVITVVSKRYEFQQQLVTVIEEIENLNFIALFSNRM